MERVSEQPHGPEPERTAQLWPRFAATGDARVRAQLVEAYRPYARMLAAMAYARRTDAALEFDDYLQYALVGMIEAIDRFDPARGVKFETFASSRVTGAMLNGLARASDMHEQIAARKRILGQRVAALGAAAPPSAVEAMFAHLAEVAIGLAIGFALEETGMLHADGEYRDNSYHGVELRQLRAQLGAALDGLPPLQRKVVHGHYLQQQSFAEIAAAQRLSAGRISQLHKEALGSLKQMLRARGGMDLRC